eukprot:jgi/Tetstr1/461523/TSEL_006629.t1
MGSADGERGNSSARRASEVARRDRSSADAHGHGHSSGREQRDSAKEEERRRKSESRDCRSPENRNGEPKHRSGERRDSARRSSHDKRPSSRPLPDQSADALADTPAAALETALVSVGTTKKARATAVERRNSRERAIVESAFYHFDTDGSGYIEKGELAGLAKELGYALSREELKALLKEMDTDGKPDGRISLKDWWMKEFGSCSMKDRLVKAVLRMWLKIRSAAAEAAPVGCAGVGWGGQFGWKALTSAKSALTSGDVKVSVGWSDDASEAAKLAIMGEKMPKEDYQAVMQEMRAPSSTVALLSMRVQLRDSTPPDDMKTLQKALSAALAQHCAALADALTDAAPAFGIEGSGGLGESPARGGGVTFVSLRPRVQHAGGLLFESIVATLAKAGLTFTDFPTFKIDLNSSASLRHLLARGPQHLLSSLAFRLDLSWDVRRRLIRKLMGLVETSSPATIILGSMLISVMSEIPLHSPGELLSDMEPLDDDDLSPDFQAKARTGDGSPVKGARGEALGADGKEGGEADWDWRVALKQLTGQQLKAWIKDGLARADERMAAEGRDAERKAFSLLKRHALCVPSITMFMAGAKVEVTQPEDAPLLPIDTLLNPDLADVAKEGEA